MQSKLKNLMIQSHSVKTIQISEIANYCIFVKCTFDLPRKFENKTCLNKYSINQYHNLYTSINNKYNISGHRPSSSKGEEDGQFKKSSFRFCF